jgi:TnpA family transposase
MRSWHVAFLGLREFPSDLTEFELAFFFSYSDAERSAIASRRGELHQLAGAIHLGFIKMTGRMLDSFEMIPRPLLEHLGDILGIAVPTLASLRALYSRRSTLFEHQRWAAQILGFQSLTDRQERYLATLLRKEAQKTVTQGPLLQFTKRWLYEQHVLIPGERRLLDLVRAAIPQAERDMLEAIASAIPGEVRARWLSELFHPHRGRQSVLEWLQKDPKKASRTSLTEQVQRVAFLKGLGVHAYPLDEIRLERQRRYAQRMRRRRPARFQEIQEPRRTLELVCFLRMTLLQTADVLISLADKKALRIRHDTVARVTGENTQRLIALRQRICALQAFARSADRTADELREAIFSLLADEDGMTFTSRAAETRYRMSDNAYHIRPLLKALLVLDFEGAPENPLIEAIKKLRGFYRDDLSRLPADTDGSFAPLWQQIIQAADRARAFRAYEAAVLYKLRKALRNGSVWVSYSLSYRSRDQLLIPATQWAEERKHFYRRLDVPMDPSQFLDRFTPLVETGLEQLAEIVESAGVEIEKGELLVHKLEAEETSPQVEQTRQALFRAIGHVQLPDLIMEMDSHTRFSVLLLGRAARSERELLTIYGALLAHGTDMTARSIALMIPGVSETAIAEAMHLLEDDQALRASNDASIEFMRRHAITGHWGEGAFASADAMSLDTTRHLYSARIDPRRRTPGIGIYTHKLDHWGLIYDQPVVLMQRQAGVAIEGMVRQQSSGDIERLAVDTHGFTYFAMAIAKVLSFDLCPRLKGLRRQKLHVPAGTAIPSILEPIVEPDITLQQIESGWDSFIRVAASVEGGWTSGVLALERFGAASRADPIHKCGTALGKVLLTLFLCDFLNNETFRRELLRILNRGESTHTLMRAIHSGNISAARGRRRDELVAISGSLTLLSNLAMAWTTHHMQAVLDTWQQESRHEIDGEVLKHIGPLHFEGINFRGTFHFPVHKYLKRLIRQGPEEGFQLGEQ